MLYQHKSYHGYFIDTENKEVYSIKSGVIKKIKHSKFYMPYYMAQAKNAKHLIGQRCWYVSHEGERRTIFETNLQDYIDVDGTQTDIMIGIKKQ